MILFKAEILRNSKKKKNKIRDPKYSDALSVARWRKAADVLRNCDKLPLVQVNSHRNSSRSTKMLFLFQSPALYEAEPLSAVRWNSVDSMETLRSLIKAYKWREWSSFAKNYYYCFQREALTLWCSWNCGGRAV